MASASAPVKYPKTPHLPFSPGVMDDDVILAIPSSSENIPILSEEVVVTEKLDGGNCCISQGKVFARTTNSEATHPSFGPIKQLASQLSYLVPHNIQLFGENMFGIHSLEYDGLGSYLYLFAALEDQSRWLSWDRVVEIADEVDIPTVPVEARMQFSSMGKIQSFIEKKMKESSNCGSCSPEGFVVRTVDGFPYSELGRHVAKYVRVGHVQTSDDWRRTWKQAKICKK